MSMVAGPVNVLCNIFSVVAAGFKGHLCALVSMKLMDHTCQIYCATDRCEKKQRTNGRHVLTLATLTAWIKTSTAFIRNKLEIISTPKKYK